MDILVIVATITSSITLPLTGVGLIVIPMSTGIACGLAISNKLINETIMGKYKSYKKHNEKDQQTIKSFEKIYRKKLQDNLIENN